MLYALAREAHPEDFDYPSFLLVLDFLFMIKAIDMVGTTISRGNKYAS
tara:strand:+ start:313 stop:456 length:144 start_codon:yes stop_codon:yes gene_type:complete